MPILLLLVAALLALLPAIATAHNTAIAVATPLAQVVVDGDLSEWPEDLPRYPVAAEAGFVTPPTDAADLRAWFRVAYDPTGRYLYLAIEAEDESIVVVDSARAWNASDGCEVFLDIGHDKAEAAVVQHALYGVQRRVFRQGADSVAADSAWVKAAAQRGDGGHRYEWRFDVDGMTGGRVRLTSPRAIGFDVVVADRDADESFTWVAWGRQVGKTSSPERVGDLVLAPADGVAQVRGQVRWSAGSQRPPRRVRVVQRGAPADLWLQVGVDGDGTYAVDLPPGDYTVDAVDLRVPRGQAPRALRVEAGRAAPAADLVVAPAADPSILVDQLFADLDPGQPGAAVLVARHGEILHQAGYGLANVELGVPITPATKFRIASVSKTFTTTALMMLVEEGRLDLDAPLSTYLPDYPHADSLTTRLLMSHLSGIPNYLSMDRFWEAASVRRGLPELMTLFRDLDLAFVPGTRYSYSNSGYVLLAHLLETLSGQTHEAFLREHIFAPLGMADTGVDDYRTILPQRAAGYALSDGELTNTIWLDMRLLTGTGSLYSTVGDLLTWDRALSSGTLLRPETVTQMWTRQRRVDGNRVAYGLGFMLGEQDGLRTVGHDGLISGFTARYTRFPEHGLTVIVLDNSPTIWPWLVARNIGEIYLANEMVWEVASGR